MRKFLKHIIVFCIIFFIAEKGVWFILNETPKKQYDKRLEALINRKINKDVIVLGSSRGSGNILAGQLEKETGLESYNLSYQGSNVNFQNFILKTLLKFNKKPKYVLLTIDNSSQFTVVESLNFRKDVLQPLTKYNYINNELVKRNIANSLSYTFYIVRLNDSHLFKKVFIPKINPLDSFGTKSIISKNNTVFEYNSTIPVYNQNQEEKQRLQAFKEIQEICKSNQIKLIFVFCPNFSMFDSNFYSRFKTLVQPENQVFVYDTLNKKYKNENYFRDESHLIKIGAEIFTSEISAFINKNK